MMEIIENLYEPYHVVLARDYPFIYDGIIVLPSILFIYIPNRKIFKISKYNLDMSKIDMKDEKFYLASAKTGTVRLFHKGILNGIYRTTEMNGLRYFVDFNYRDSS